MYEIPVALFYSALFLMIIYRSRFFRVDGIGNTWFSFAFLVKLVFGISNLLIWYYIMGHGDSLNYFSDSKLIYHTLPENPWHFLQLTFGYRNDNSYPPDLRYISDFMIYSWNNVEYTMVRINAILDVFTFGSAFGNVIILAFIYFCGAVALLKLLVKFFSDKVRLLFAIFFFFPSVVFWGSGLLKEGFAILLISLLWMQLINIEKERESNIDTGHQYNSRKRILCIILILAAIFLIRDFLLLLIIPNLFLWRIAVERKKNNSWLFTGITCLIIILIFIADFAIDLPGRLQHIQAYFDVGVSEPDYHFYHMDGTIAGLMNALPPAVNNILFRPNLFHSSGLFRMYESIELPLVWIFILFCLLRWKRQSLSPALLFMLFFSIELLFVYGLIVTDADTLSRYRTLPLFFLLLLVVISSKRAVSNKL